MSTIHSMPSPDLDPTPVVVELGNVGPTVATTSPVAAVEPSVKPKRKYTRRTPQNEETTQDG